MLHLTAVLLFLGRKPEEEGVEDNGLEENSRDGQVSEMMIAVPKNVHRVTCSKHTFTFSLCRRILKQIWTPCRILT